MKKPELTNCDCNPQLDPMHRDTGGLTLTCLYVDLETGNYGITQEMDDNASSADEWNGITRSAYSHQHYSERAAGAWLEDSDTVALVQRVLDGGSVDWDGSNMTGSLDDDAQAAWEELVDGLDALPESEYTVWDINDWAHEWITERVAAETTNTQIVSMAAELEALAVDECVILTGDVLDALYHAREDALDGWITTDRAAALVGLETSHIRRMCREGKLPGKKTGRDWLVWPFDLRGVERIKAGRPRKIA